MESRQDAGTTGASDPSPAPRAAQRRRTRAAIVAATQQLLRDGAPSPSVDQIAAAADVSRRTVYMYFPTLDQLVLDAAAGLLSSDHIDAALASTSDVDARDRMDALITAILDQAEQTLPIGRQIIRLTIDQTDETGPASVPPDSPRRGFRRVQWLERALEPLRPQLTTEQFERLLSALAVVTGWESMAVLQDVRALDPDGVRRVSTWAAKALIDAMMIEPAATAASTTRPRKSAAARIPRRR